MEFEVMLELLIRISVADHKPDEYNSWACASELLHFVQIRNFILNMVLTQDQVCAKNRLQNRLLLLGRLVLLIALATASTERHAPILAGQLKERMVPRVLGDRNNGHREMGLVVIVDGDFDAVLLHLLRLCLSCD